MICSYARIFFILSSSLISHWAHHEGIDHWAQYGLQQQQHGAYWTLVSDDSVTITNGGLCLDGEKESWYEAINVVDAWRPRLILQMVQIPPWQEKECVRKGRGGQCGCEEGESNNRTRWFIVKELRGTNSANSSFPLFTISLFKVSLTSLQSERES